MNRLSRLLVALSFSAAATTACLRAAAPLPAETALKQKLSAILQPDRTESATLSPDGQHLAYTLYSKGELRLVISKADLTEVWTGPVIGKDAAPPSRGFIGTSRGIPPTIPFLEWADSSHLVYLLVDSSKPATTYNASGPRFDLHVIAVDGKTDRKLAGREEFNHMVTPSGANGPPSPSSRASLTGTGVSNMPAPALALGMYTVLGLTAEEPKAVVIETPEDKDRKLYRIDIATGAKTGVLLKGTRGALITYDRDYRPRVAQMSAEGLARGLDPRSFTDPAFAYWFSEYAPSPTSKGKNPPLIPEFQYSAADPFRPHSFPLGFGEDPNILYIGSNARSDTWGVEAINLTTKLRTDFAIAEPDFDQVDPRSTSASAKILVRDRQLRVVGFRVRGARSSTRWLDAELALWQTRLELRFPGRNVKILEWNDSKQRVLALIYGLGDRGGFYVFDSGETMQPEGALGIVPRSALQKSDLGVGEVFTFFSSQGVRLTGTLVRPPEGTAKGLILYCHEIPGIAVSDELNELRRHQQALAALGYAVAEVNYRGTFGFGETHLGPGRAEPDRLAAEDLRAAAEELISRNGFDATKVSLLGVGFGGYLALRAADLNPGVFNSVVAIDAPSDPQRWMDEVAGPYFMYRVFLSSDHTPYPDLRTRANRIKVPVQVIYETEEGRRTGVDDTHPSRLRDALKKAGNPADYVALGREYSAGTPEEKAAVYLRIGEFLDRNMDKARTMARKAQDADR